MPYITTKVQALKSYATYQLYASADSKTADTDGVFKICISDKINVKCHMCVIGANSADTANRCDSFRIVW